MGNKTLEEMGLVHYWSNDQKYSSTNDTGVSIEVLDTSLRDGLQDPSITQPDVKEKLKFVDLLDRLGIQAADIGFPVSSENHKADVVATAQHMVASNSGVKICVLARTQVADIEAAAEVSQKAGVPVEAITIVGSSDVRHLVEKWTMSGIKKWVEKSVMLAKKHNLEFNFLTEDGTRSRPEVIRELYGFAIDLGVERVSIADTVGSATPDSSYNIVKYLKDEVIGDRDVPIDWHGHNDRDLATANSLAAIKAGATRIHVTSLGIGERAGNNAMEGLVANLQMMGLANLDLSVLPELADCASRIFNFPISPNHPSVGEMVHSTSVGIHASSISKALEMGRRDLADTVYNGVDPSMFGKHAEIHIGPLSGKANVLYVANKIGISEEKLNEDVIESVLEKARNDNKILTAEDITSILK